MPDSLPEDLAQRVGENTTRLVPEEGQTGDFLRVTGQMPFSYAFQQGPDEEIPRYPGPPDGNLTAPIDSLVRNTVDHTVWINTDGDTAWTPVGSSFPIIYDDGTYTYSITASGGLLEIQAWANASPGDVSSVTFDASTAFTRVSGDSGVSIEGDGFVNVSDVGSGMGIAIQGNEIIVQVPNLLLRGQTAAPAGLAALPVGSFGFWVDTGTWELKVRAHEGSGVMRNLTIGTLT